MNGKSIYRVTYRGVDHYFGSITAIYDVFTAEQLHVARERLWQYKITAGNPYKNAVCEIHKGELHRHPTCRKLPHIIQKPKDDIDY